MPHLYDLAGNEMTWAEAKARAEAWYEREGQRECEPPALSVAPHVFAPKKPSTDLIIRTLEREARVPRGTIQSARRDSFAVELRDAVVLSLRMQGWSVAKIASALNRHRTAIDSALARATNRQDPAFLELVEGLYAVSA